MSKVLLHTNKFNLTLRRLCQQLLESHGDFSNSCMVGIQPRGTFLSNRLRELLVKEEGLQFDYGLLDITFHRDDFRLREKPLQPYPTEISFVTENKRVILVDDVLYTGRTIQAALAAINHFGRPAEVELLTLVDRRFNRHIPIQADYTGVRVDAVDDAYVRVDWQDNGQENEVLLFSAKTKS